MRTAFRVIVYLLPVVLFLTACGDSVKVIQPQYVQNGRAAVMAGSTVQVTFDGGASTSTFKAIICPGSGSCDTAQPPNGFTPLTGFSPAPAPGGTSSTVIPDLHAAGDYTLAVYCDWNGSSLFKGVGGLVPLTFNTSNFGFSPSPASVFVGGSTMVSISPPSGVSGSVSVTLSTTAGGVATVSPNATAPGTFNIGGVAPGNATINATGIVTISGVMATATGQLPVTVPTPGFSLTPNLPTATVAWGDPPTSFGISTQSIGGFPGQITLADTGAPSGSHPTFSSNPVPVGQSSNLTISTTMAGTQLGSFQIPITGMSGAVSAQTAVTLNVLRSRGPFVEATPLSGNQVCGNVAAYYDTSTTNNFVVYFQVYPGSTAPPGAPLPPNHLPPGVFQTTPPPQAAYYAISPKCRVGLVMPGLQSNPQPLVEVYNLGFPTNTHPVAVIPNQAGANLNNWLWRRFYFSPDDSLMYSVARLSGGAGMLGPHAGDLRNVITGASHQCGFQFIPKLTTNGATEDSTDFLPDITSVTLGADGITVTVVYNDQNSHSQSFTCSAP